MLTYMKKCIEYIQKVHQSLRNQGYEKINFIDGFIPNAIQCYKTPLDTSFAFSSAFMHLYTAIHTCKYMCIILIEIRKQLFKIRQFQIFIYIKRDMLLISYSYCGTNSFLLSHQQSLAKQTLTLHHQVTNSHRFEKMSPCSFFLYYILLISIIFPILIELFF